MNSQELSESELLYSYMTRWGMTIAQGHVIQTVMAVLRQSAAHQVDARLIIDVCRGTPELTILNPATGKNLLNVAFTPDGKPLAVDFETEAM